MAGPTKDTTGGAGWQDQPTTNVTEARAVAVVAAKYGVKAAAQFKTWYDAARKKDPAITPNQATTAWVAAYVVGKGVSATGQLVASGVPNAAAKAAESLAPGGSSAACALHIPSFGPFGGWCVISKTALRATVGGLMLVGAGAVGITAVIILAAHGLDSTQAGQALRKSGAAVKGAAAVLG